MCSCEKRLEKISDPYHISFSLFYPLSPLLLTLTAPYDCYNQPYRSLARGGWRLRPGSVRQSGVCGVATNRPVSSASRFVCLVPWSIHEGGVAHGCPSCVPVGYKSQLDTANTPYRSDRQGERPTPLQYIWWENNPNGNAP